MNTKTEINYISCSNDELFLFRFMALEFYRYQALWLSSFITARWTFCLWNTSRNSICWVRVQIVYVRVSNILMYRLWTLRGICWCTFLVHCALFHNVACLINGFVSRIKISKMRSCSFERYLLFIILLICFDYSKSKGNLLITRTEEVNESKNKWLDILIRILLAAFAWEINCLVIRSKKEERFSELNTVFILTVRPVVLYFDPSTSPKSPRQILISIQ